MEDADDLITPLSLRLSLSAPRAPPYGTLHHALLSSPYKIIDDFDFSVSTESGKIHDEHDGTLIESKHKLRRLLPDFHVLERLPHPHLPYALSLGDTMTRSLGTRLPLQLQNKLRDSGAFRSICDTLVTVSAPTLALSNPHAILKFITLSKKMKRFSYGSHPMQEIHFYEPEFSKGFVFFVVSVYLIR